MRKNYSLKVDSLDLLIPIERLLSEGLIKKESLPEKFIVSDPRTGEVIEEIGSFRGLPVLKSKDLRFHEADRYKIYKKHFLVSQTKREWFLVVELTAKNNPIYFNGVTREAVVSFLLDLKYKGYLSFDVDDIDEIISSFLVSDVDIAFDYFLPKNSFSSYYLWYGIQLLGELAELYALETDDRCVTIFDKDNNRGVEFAHNCVGKSKYENRSGKNYFKIYDKVLSLRYKTESVSGHKISQIEALKPILAPHFNLLNDYEIIRHEISFLNRKILRDFDVPLKFDELLEDIVNNEEKYFDILRHKINYFVRVKTKKPNTDFNDLGLSPQKLNLAVFYSIFIYAKENVFKELELSNDDEVKENIKNILNKIDKEFPQIAVQFLISHSNNKDMAKLKHDRKKLFNEVINIVKNNQNEITTEIDKIKANLEESYEVLREFSKDFGGVYDDILKELYESD